LKFDMRFLMFDLQSARQFPSNFEPQTSNILKGGESDVAWANS